MVYGNQDEDEGERRARLAEILGPKLPTISKICAEFGVRF